jgi:uncharacterized protein (DUF488 family)
MKRGTNGWKGRKVIALGHSTRPFEELLAMLEEHGVEVLVDVRTVPGSRKNPQFNPEELAPALGRAGIGYAHIAELGGLRRGIGEASVNKAWRNASFRAYADHMQTETFERGLEELLELAENGPIAVMCAEAVPWRCHRSLLADALVARGAEVLQAMSPGKAAPHRVTPFARIRGTRVTYPAE